MVRQWVERVIGKNRRPILLAVFVAINVVALGVFLFQRFPPFPIGWDAPYYISRIRYFLEQGVVTNRMGYIGLSAAIHLLLGAPLITLQVAATLLTSTLIALASALLVYRPTAGGTTRFAFVFLLVLWSHGFFALAITTIDNAFALAFALFALGILARSDGSPRSVVAFGAMTALLAITHLETLAFLLVTVVVFLLLTALRTRDLGAVLRRYRWYFAAGVPSLGLAVLQWGPTLGGIVGGYLQRGDPLGNASIPYADPKSISAVLRYLSTGIAGPFETMLFLLGAGVALGYYLRRADQRTATAVAAYGIVAYAVLVFSVVGGSIPINRSTPLLPVSLFLGLGVATAFRWLVQRSRIGAGAVGALALLIITLTVPTFAIYALRFPPSIHHQSYAGLSELTTFVREQDIPSFVLLGETPPDVVAASAYYGLWTNWLTALAPLPDATRAHCVYLGRVENLVRGEPTLRDGNREYNETSAEGLRCVRTLPPDAPIFVVRYLYAPGFPNGAGIQSTPIGEHVVQVHRVPLNAAVPTTSG